jgi:hypothetical protein
LPVALNTGLAIGCIIIGALMLVIGGWFTINGIRDKDWSTFIFSLMILGVAGFAFYSAFHLFIW